MRAAIYLRVSTSEQSTEAQRHELEVVAERRGWQVVEVYADNGISGAKGREKRPGFDAMLKAATRREFDVLMAWSVDRLGRSLQHLVAFLGDLDASGCNLYLHRQHLDTTSPSGRALFGMLAVFSEFERAIIRERVVAGMARAKRQGRKFGRPKVRVGAEEKIRAALRGGASIPQAARAAGCSTTPVQRVRKAMLAAGELGAVER